VRPARIGQLLGLALLVAGIALLALPYDADLTLVLPSGEVFQDAELPSQVACEAPLADLFHGEPEVWINYAPSTGTRVGRGERLSGSYCEPESVQRGIAGMTLALVGVLLVGAATVLVRRRADDRTASDGPAGDPTSGDEPPDLSSAPG
jgi:drug/metabolite transporter (DMT)-like permease